MTKFVGYTLNLDDNDKLTSAVYDTDLAAWVQKSQMHVLNASGILVPLALDVNGRLQMSVKDSALPEGAASAAKQDALAALVATAANQATMQNLIGALNSAAIVDPTANAAVIQLLKGLLKQLQGTGTAGTSAPVQLSGSKVKRAFTVTPSDTEDLAYNSVGIIVTTAGNVKVTLVDDADPVILPNLAAGSFHPIEAKRIWATDTTATGVLVAW